MLHTDSESSFHILHGRIYVLTALLLLTMFVVWFHTLPIRGIYRVELGPDVFPKFKENATLSSRWKE
jgi:hypothetical protein